MGTEDRLVRIEEKIDLLLSRQATHDARIEAIEKNNEKLDKIVMGTGETPGLMEQTRQTARDERLIAIGISTIISGILGWWQHH
jgi:hypothetical protein